MINTKTYLTKTNTIIKDNYANLGLNPIVELNYGRKLSRAILYFDHEKVKRLVDDKTYPDMNKLKHVLRMVNTASITSKNINNPCMMVDDDRHKERAVSFDLIFFFIPSDWDDGRGFDYVMDLYDRQHRGVSTQASNWYFRKNYIKWPYEGIYTTDRLSTEMDLFTSKDGNLSEVIFGWQHFDYGNEDIALDITCVFNKFITGELENHGIGIAFSPSFEQMETHMTQYVGFFGPFTHSFFKPYVETTYNETIEDDRSNFYLEKENKLYFYVTTGGNPVNLDEMPTCTLNGSEYEVKQATKGVYYINATLSTSEYETDTMLYDTWGNLKFGGISLKDITLEFVTKSPMGYYNFGLPNNQITDSYDFVPLIHGINYKEQINRGCIRKVVVDCKIPYTPNQQILVDGMEYRLYVMTGEREYDVIGWSKVERGYSENYFLLNTEDLIPERYYIDIRSSHNLKVEYYYKLLSFDVAENVSEIRR